MYLVSKRSSSEHIEHDNSVSFHHAIYAHQCRNQKKDGSKPGPGSGTYQITKLEGKQELAKTIYYGTEASGAAYFFNSHHKDFSAGKRFIVTHLAASYANDSSDAFYGTNSTGEALAMELYHYAVSQPEIPNVEMSFSNSNVTAYVDGGQQLSLIHI